MLYADVILPLPLQDLYTYAVPVDLENIISEGHRVIVQFGQRKYYTAIVFKLYEADKKIESVKEITSLLEDFPIVLPLQLKLWEWISSYYMCSLGDVYKAALPSALKLESETFVYLNPDYEANEPLTTKELEIFKTLPSLKPIKISEIAKNSNISNIIPYIKSLAEKKVIYISENISNSYSAKTESAVRMKKAFDEKELIALLDSLKRAKLQQYLLSCFLDIQSNQEIILKNQLLNKADVSPAVLAELVKKNILEIYQIETGRFDFGETNIESAYALNEYQQNALEEIKTSFTKHVITLLYGVTSSGKTEIYIQLIKDAISKGQQVLYLLPEIALTTQITNRLKSVFGNKLAVFHSKFNDNERAETWNRLLKDDECQIVLGARSAIFLPFKHLGLIIVDEEHESSYKQQDPAPRYNARNAAIMLGNMSGSKVLLGTATPSTETYHNALSGRYGLVRLTKRYEDIAMPDIQIVDTKELRRKKQMKSLLSPPLINSIKNTLDQKKQVILFQNRRGFASILECKNCSWTPTCNHCDVSLTFHKGQQSLVCHYCGATYPVPHLCSDCQTPTLDPLGYGTERVEEEVGTLFPEASTARMDLDTTRGKTSFEKIISDFEEGKTDILIGTQMVSKGLDFENVSLVGILNADNLLNYPDFRAYERAYQLLTQVSGRAGRKNKKGLVILQTSKPSNPVIQAVKANSFDNFYLLQNEERRMFHYPPFFRLISIILKGKNESNVENTAKMFANELRQSLADRVLGPGKPPIARIQSLYIRKILIKIESQASLQKIKDHITMHQTVIKKTEMAKNILFYYDVDPM